jgi:hypothetical protein
VGYALSYPHPLYPLGEDILPFVYPWIWVFYHTLILMGKNPLGKRVMGTHCHQESDQLFQRYKDQVPVLKSRSALVSVSRSSFCILISRLDQTLILRARGVHILLHHSQKIQIIRRIAYRSAYSFSVRSPKKKRKSQLVQTGSPTDFTAAIRAFCSRPERSSRETCRKFLNQSAKTRKKRDELHALK